MKPYITLIFLLIFSTVTFTNAQSVILLEQDSLHQINEDVDISSWHEDFLQALYFKNNTNETIMVNWRREFMDNCPLEWDVFVADQILSYTPDIDESQFPIELNPTDSHFVVRQWYYPRNTPGCCDIKMIFSLEGSPNTPIDTGYYHIEINAEGCMSTSIVDLPKTTFDLYPNPTSNFLKITSNTEYKSIEIINISGKMLITKPKSSTNKIDVSTLTPGIYYCKLNLSSGKILMQRFVKI